MRSGLGLEPWNVLHQGLSERTGLSMGVVLTIVGAVVLLLWIPLRQRPGLGTVSNVLVIGAAMDATLALVPDAHGMAVRVVLMTAGIVLNGAATGLYIAARFGPGPRDGLMTGLNRRTGVSVRLVRTLIEITVVVTGFLLGGTVGVGTLLYAVAIGPLAQVFLRVFEVPGGPTAPRSLRAGSPGRRYCGRDRADTPPLPRPSRTARLRPPGRGRPTGWRTPSGSSGAPSRRVTGTSRPTSTPRATAGSSPSTTPPWTG